MQIDYHTHHVRCGHAEGTLEQYVQKAIEIGLDHIGLSDHMPLIHLDPETYPFKGMAMPYEELPHYVEEAFALKSSYADRIQIRVGMEADYIEGYEDEIRKLIEAYPWDYVIGSVHFLGDWDITDFRQTEGWSTRDANEVYRRYYDAIRKAAKTGFYDIIGHVDVIKRFGFKPTEDMTEVENETLRTIAECGTAIELNASGLRMPCAEMFPSRRMLAEAKRLGIPVTLGSDAHQPERLGQYLNEARNTLKEVGFTQLAVFERRIRSLVSF
ncbi:histidinol-phosphatase HisJ [Paenibacillus turpanensis]|uniref:histidinol-phosphatase HisJ n=1 Tax=Paenibacillus turpanensis TaxID=2689078 RepID=UPI00140D5145|nr:histidinol-phosphatase HisJ [Paenibacillus turpanensis]